MKKLNHKHSKSLELYFTFGPSSYRVNLYRNACKLQLDGVDGIQTVNLVKTGLSRVIL